MASNGIVGATKGKIWRDAIRRAVNGDSKQLERLAKKLVQMAEEGDMAAMKEIGDRLDGKPKQQIESDTTLKGELTVQLVRYADNQTAG